MSASRTKSKRMRQKTHRYTSNVFSMFSQEQIQEFKEAFNMIDQNRDGFIDKEDLIEMMTSLGKNPSDDFLDHMVAEAPGPINFTMFLTLFGERLNGTDPEDVIKNAFACFDDKQLGFLTEERLREAMTTMGDRWTDEMVDELFHTAPIQEGNFDYVEFIRTLKHGHKDKDEEKMDNNAKNNAKSAAAAPPPPKTAPPPAGGPKSPPVIPPQKTHGKLPFGKQPTSPSAPKPLSPLKPMLKPVKSALKK